MMNSTLLCLSQCVKQMRATPSSFRTAGSREVDEMIADREHLGHQCVARRQKLARGWCKRIDDANIIWPDGAQLVDLLLESEYPMATVRRQTEPLPAGVVRSNTH